MTDEQKLKKLFKIASNNGYKLNYYISEYWINRNYDNNFKLEGLVLHCNLSNEPLNLTFTLSINDLFVDYEVYGEEQQVSFLGALLESNIKEFGKITKYSLRVTWIGMPVSLRLKFLFAVFNPLLI